MSSYRDLEVWRKSFDLCEKVYKYCLLLPADERFGLCSQIQRSAVSIPSNIAEGQQRGSSKDFRRFLFIAKGSAVELSTQVLLSSRLYNIKTGNLVEEVE